MEMDNFNEHFEKMIISGAREKDRRFDVDKKLNLYYESSDDFREGESQSQSDKIISENSKSIVTLSNIVIKKKKCVDQNDFLNFLREFLILRNISYDIFSTHLIHLNDVSISKDNDSEYILTFQDEGIDLVKLIKTSVIKYREVKGLTKWALFQIALGIYEMHSKKIIHRGLSLQNILISSSGKIKIIGFGSAINEEDLNYIQNKSGTICYMAPEYLIGPKYDHKIDIWSFGIIMIELLIGQPCYFLPSDKSKFDKASAIKKSYYQLKNYYNALGLPLIVDNRKSITVHDLNEIIKKTRLTERDLRKSLQKFGNFDEQTYSLLTKVLQFDPNQRCNIEDVLNSGYFNEYKSSVNELKPPQRFNLDTSFEKEIYFNMKDKPEKEKIEYLQKKIWNTIENYQNSKK